MTDEPSDLRRRRRTILHIMRRVLPLLILLIVVGGVFLYWRRVDTAPTAVVIAPTGPMPVQTVVVQRETIPIRPRFLGETEASQTVEIRARVQGFLRERNFREGQAIEKEQPLFRIESAPFEAELAQADARLAIAEARLDRAQQELTRIADLAARQAAAPTELEQLQTETRVAQGEVALNKALVDQAKLQLGYTTIESPINGVVGQSLKDVGSYVDAATNSLLAVVQQVDPIYVRYPITEQELLRWQREIDAKTVRVPETPEETDLEVTLADGSTYPYRGRINFVGVQLDPTTGTAVVRGTVPNPQNLLRPGQFVYVTALGIERVDAVRVPQRAVMQAPTGPYVYVVDAQSKVELRNVTLGEWSEDQWIVEKGLSEGDQVIIDRLMQVRPGVAVVPQPVTVASFTPAPQTQPATRPTAPSAAQSTPTVGR